MFDAAPIFSEQVMELAQRYSALTTLAPGRQEPKLEGMTQAGTLALRRDLGRLMASHEAPFNTNDFLSPIGAPTPLLELFAASGLVPALLAPAKWQDAAELNQFRLGLDTVMQALDPAYGARLERELALAEELYASGKTRSQMNYRINSEPALLRDATHQSLHFANDVLKALPGSGTQSLSR